MIYQVFIEGIYQDTSIESFEFSHAVNEHAFLSIRAMITNEQRDNFLKHKYTESTLTLKAKISSSDDSIEDEERILFCGLVDHVNLEHSQDIYYINIVCQSYTALMDMLSLNQSFQDGNQTFDSIIHTTMDRYDFYQGTWQYIAMDSRLMNPIQTLFVRYKETDWQFLKRIVSQLNIGLLPDISSHETHFWAGIPEGKQYTLEDCPYIMSQVPQVCAQLTENHLIDDGYQDIDFVQYILVKRLEVFNIGDRIRFRNLNLVVKEIICEYSAYDGLIYYQYTLSTEKGLVQPRIYNALLRGASIDGIVIDRKRSYTRLHLTIDEAQSVDQARWIVQTEYYTGGGEAGMVGMPELNTRMSLYFPSEQEEDAQIFHTHNLDFNHITNFNGETYQDGAPENQEGASSSGGARDKDTIADAKLMYGTDGMSLTTEGTELDEHILLRGNKQESKLLTLQLDQNGITLKSPQLIDLASENILIGSSIDYTTGTINTHSKKVQLSAEDEIIMQTGMSSVILDASKTIHLKALDLFLQIDGNQENSAQDLQDNFDRPLTKEEIAWIEEYNRAVDEYNKNLESTLISNNMQQLHGIYTEENQEVMYEAAKLKLERELKELGYDSIEDLYAAKIEKQGPEWRVNDVTAKKDDYYNNKGQYYPKNLSNAETERNAFEDSQSNVWNQVLQEKYGDLPAEIENDPYLTLATKQMLAEEAMPYEERNEAIRAAKKEIADKQSENSAKGSKILTDNNIAPVLKSPSSAEHLGNGRTLEDLSPEDRKAFEDVANAQSSYNQQINVLNNLTKKPIDGYIIAEHFVLTVVNGQLSIIDLAAMGVNKVTGINMESPTIISRADYSAQMYTENGQIKEGYYLDYLASPAYLRQIQPNAHASSAAIGTMAGMVANYFIPDPFAPVVDLVFKAGLCLGAGIFNIGGTIIYKAILLPSAKDISNIPHLTAKIYDRASDAIQSFNFSMQSGGRRLATGSVLAESATNIKSWQTVEAITQLASSTKAISSKAFTGALGLINAAYPYTQSLFRTIKTFSVAPMLFPQVMTYPQSISIPMSLGQPLIRERDWLLTDGRVSSESVLDVPKVWSYPLREAVINSYVTPGTAVDVWDQTKGSTIHTQTSIESAGLGSLSDWKITTLPYFDFKTPSIVFAKNNKNKNTTSSVSREEQSKMIGENGTQTSSTTTGQNGKTERVDVENGAPGERDGNIHYHEPDNTKWYYDFDSGKFIHEKTKQEAPSRIQKKLKEPWVQKGIQKAKKILGE